MMPIAVVDFKPAGSGHTLCPFLIPADAVPGPSEDHDRPLLVQALEKLFRQDQQNPVQPVAVCGIYDVRPNMCRLFPLGRIGEQKNGKLVWRYVLQDVSCGHHGPRADGLTWSEWIDPVVQAQSADGMDLYIYMIETARQQLARAGVQVDAWLNDRRRRVILRRIFYLFPCAVVPPRELRTHETAMAMCRVSADFLPGAIGALLQEAEPDAGELLAALQVWG